MLTIITDFTILNENVRCKYVRVTQIRLDPIQILSIIISEAKKVNYYNFIWSD